MEIAGNYRDKTPHIVERLDNRIRILLMKESTQGIGNGQITAEKTEKVVEKSA